MNIILAIVIFSLIILFHELGHFLVAKANKIRVSEFTLGLGPTILGFTKGETKYCLKLLPFGGSCVMDEDSEAEAGDERAFNNKSVWARLSVVAAGPIFNFIMAFILSFVVILIAGYDEPVVNYVDEDSAAYEAGLREGDLILKLNGDKTKLSRDVSLAQALYPEDTMKMVVQRTENGKKVKETIVVEPTKKEYYAIGVVFGDSDFIIDTVNEGTPAYKAGIKAGDEIVSIDGNSYADIDEMIESIKASKGQALKIGIIRDGSKKELKVTPESVISYSHGFYTDSNLNRVKAGPLKAVQYSYYEVGYWIKSTITSLKLLITGNVGLDQVSGPVGIVRVIGDTYNESRKDGWLYVFLNMVNLAILLSANLGVMNLLPIPALDGGRILFFLIEGITGKRLPQKVEGIIHLIGFALLMILMIVVLSSDIIKIFI